MTEQERSKMILSRMECDRMGGVLAMCQDLTMMVSGESDGSPEAMTELVEALHRRVNTWQPPTHNERYDNAVLELIHAAIDSYRRMIAREKSSESSPKSPITC